MVQSLVPAYTGMERYSGITKRKRRSDKKMRVKIYMTAEEKQKLARDAVMKNNTMTQYVSEMIEDIVISGYLHKQNIPVQEFESKESFIHVKLSQDTHHQLRIYAFEHGITNEQACLSWFIYSQLSYQKKRADERKYIEMNKTDDEFWNNSSLEIIGFDENRESGCIY